eukprot:m.54383 g.54383  ORF g.54383 m.54383 type:complete len:1067 (-) comp7523_c0_seq1:106-3306(-)
MQITPLWTRRLQWPLLHPWFPSLQPWGPRARHHPHPLRCGTSSAGTHPRELPKQYNPDEVETQARYDAWRPSFAPASDMNESEDGSSKRFVMMLPPPNVTGTLHLGHALTIAIQDTIARWRRSKGDDVLWLPGSDHAGIATQTVVEKELMRTSGHTRHDVGRSAFVDAVWKWKEEKGSAILRQMERLGASLDWSRSVFTLDDGYSHAVTEAFVQLYERGLVYRSERIVNWSPSLQSALSDIEVDKHTLDGPVSMTLPGYSDPVEFGRIYRVLYAVEGASGESVEVATTRPETMLGDVAVAVHSQDPRYTHLHGARVINPVTQTAMPIVLDDELVDRELGTGVVKITPAHDANDYRAGQRHGLPSVAVMDTAGQINWPKGPGSQFHAMPRFEARAALLKELEAAGHLCGTDPHAMVLPVCSRSGDVIEPMLSPQWFVDCQSMAQRALDVQRSGELTILPPQFVKTWSDWLENIDDWCISRQLWWGHRVPAYRAWSTDAAPGGGDGRDDAAEVWVVGRTEDDARRSAADQLGIPPDAVVMEQDEDVLDTWFASALFPFAALGWPQHTVPLHARHDDMKRFYPGTLLETGHDILFFWVARMVMLGLELTDTLPFRHVYLHAMIRDAQGKKMSKSLGNVIDPSDVIDGISMEDLVARVTSNSNLPKAEVSRAAALQKKQFPHGIPACGADALRFALLSYTSHARDIKFDVERVTGHRAFLNKVWNATRFVLRATDTTHASATAAPPGVLSPSDIAARFTSKADEIGSTDVAADTLPSAWILSRLATTVDDANSALQEYNFIRYTVAMQHFWINDFCDTYIEVAKHQLKDPQLAPHTVAVLLTCVDVATRLLAPATPHVADAILDALPHNVGDPGSVPSTTSSSTTSRAYPATTDWKPCRSLQVEHDMAHVLEIARAVRAIPVRQIDPHARLIAYVSDRDAEGGQGVLKAGHGALTCLSRASEVHVLNAGDARPDNAWTVPTQTARQCVVWAKTATPLDPEAIQTELTRLSASRKGLLASRDKITRRMTGTGYARAPEHVQEKDAQTLAQLARQVEETTALMAMYEEARGV